jgi:hypothetical protein
VLGLAEFVVKWNMGGEGERTKELKRISVMGDNKMNR